MSRAVGPALATLVRVNFVNFTGAVHVETMAHTPWTSVTFAGARHRLRVVLAGPGAVGTAADFLHRLPDLDLPLPGAIVADIALISEERRDCGLHAALEFEVLTIEDR